MPKKLIAVIVTYQLWFTKKTSLQRKTLQHVFYYSDFCSCSSINLSVCSTQFLLNHHSFLFYFQTVCCCCRFNIIYFCCASYISLSYNALLSGGGAHSVELCSWLVCVFGWEQHKVYFIGIQKEEKKNENCTSTRDEEENFLFAWWNFISRIFFLLLIWINSNRKIYTF